MDYFIKDGKYFKRQVEINRRPFYQFIKIDEEGKILEVLEKPNLKYTGMCHVSGEHIIINDIERNHYDHSSGAITCGVMKIKNWKEYPVTEGRTYESKYLISGLNLAISPEWDNPASFAIVARI